MIKLIKQIIKFGIVGGLCFVIDYGLLIFLTEVISINYLISSGISFSASVIVNYILSLKYVFETDKKNNKVKECLIFIVLSIIGINQVIMWLCVDKLKIFYMIAKIAATIIVMVYNFVTRKLILEKK